MLNFTSPEKLQEAAAQMITSTLFRCSYLSKWCIIYVRRRNEHGVIMKVSPLVIFQIDTMFIDDFFLFSPSW